MKRTITGAILIGFIALSGISYAGDKKEDAATAAMNALKAMGLGGATSTENVEIIGWRELAKLLPKELDGLETGKIKGGTFKMGGAPVGGMPDSISGALKMFGGANSYSSAERTYTDITKDGKNGALTIRVMDAGILKAMLAPFMMTIEYDTPEGLLKSVEIGGHPAKIMQKFDDDLEVIETSYMILVKNRVLVQIEGNQYIDSKRVTTQANDFPYAKLDKLAGVEKPEAPLKQ